jgi:hypothetical protein
MATTLFELAQEDPEVMDEIAAAVSNAAGGDIDSVNDVVTLVSRATTDAAFKASLQASLEAVAEQNDVTLDTSTAATSTVTAVAISSAYASLQAQSHEADSTSIPISTPELLEYIAAVAIFAPSLLSTL